MEITWSFPFAELFHIFKANQDLTRASKRGNESRKCSTVLQNVLEAMIPELNIRNIMKYHRTERSKQIHTWNIIFSNIMNAFYIEGGSYFVGRRFWVFSIVESTTFKMRKL